MGRPFLSPPFLFAFFRWLRPLSLDAAMDSSGPRSCSSRPPSCSTRCARRIAGESLPPGLRHEAVIVCALLLFQYPFVFALMRAHQIADRGAEGPGRDYGHQRHAVVPREQASVEKHALARITTPAREAGRRAGEAAQIKIRGTEARRCDSASAPRRGTAAARDAGD